MRTFTTLLAASAFASSALAADIPGVLNALNSLNLTSLAGAVTAIANTTGGARLLSIIQSDQQVTLLAPNNGAFAGVNPYFANDPLWLQQALSYHVIVGTVQVSDIPKSPASVIYPTALNDTEIVQHIGSAPQYIGLTRVGNTSFVTNQNNIPSVVLKTVTYQNILVHVVSTVIDLPPSALDALANPTYPWTTNLTTLVKTIPADLVNAFVESKSVTLFAPINQAWVDAVNYKHIPPNLNGTQLSAAILNHIVNGTILFSGSAQKDYTSAAGETLTFGNGGAFGTVVYYRGNLVANVVQGNIITKNGVVHLIDAVLPNINENLAAATSAFSAASVSATQSAQPAKRSLGGSRLFRV